jgi:hypothetical protein
MKIDTFKLTHWMNVRKVTPAQLAAAAGVEAETLARLLAGEGDGVWPDDLVTAVADGLRVDPGQLSGAAQRDLTVVCQAPEGLHGTRRPIQRDGIHFYNYYTMATPPGRVGPVILDILCPPGRLPALNNGHLEPAVTVNLGPGDIHGRWGFDLGDATWRALAANHGEDDWIVGDSYVEPPYCPHSYSLVDGTPARIISYTAQSNLAPLVEEANNWSSPAFAAWADLLDRDGLSPLGLLEVLLTRRGHTLDSATEQAGVLRGAVQRALAGELDQASVEALRTLGRVLGFDYRMLLPAERRHDEVGKTSCTVAESRATLRRFRSYTVASMASAPHLPDLTGMFVRVDSDADGHGDLDLLEAAETHYLVVAGELTLLWRDADGQVASKRLGRDGTAWVAPFVAHRWGGRGAVAKLGSGRHVGYLDWFELTDTYAAASTLQRGRRDAVGWGYDT